MIKLLLIKSQILSKQAIIIMKMMISVTLKAQMWTSSSFVTLGSLEFFSSPPSVIAVSQLWHAVCVFVCISLYV